jgi:hypothetical protein
MWVVLKCLSLCVGLLALKPPRVTIIPDLIAPSLNILIKTPRLLHAFRTNLQAVLLDGLRKHLHNTIL